MERVVITGASGFIGQNLVPYLEKNNLDPVSLTLRNDWRLPHDAYAIVHLAGKAHDTKSVSNPGEYFSVNTILTKKLFNDFLVSDASIFVFISSVKAVADKVDGILTEEAILNPKTAYGQSKRQAEDYLLTKRLPDGKRVFILRPCMIHGPGNKGNLNLLYKIASMGIPYPLAAFTNERSFLSMENLCFAIRELLNKADIPLGIYNVSDDMPLSTNRVMEIMGEELLKKIRFLRVNTNIIKFIARVGDFFPFPLNSERLSKLTENYVVSNRKLVAVLNKSLPLDAETGLRKTVQSFIHR